MLLLLLFLGSSQNGILCTMQYTVNIYCFCTCITVHTCTCAPASTCTPVSTYTFCSDLVTFFHICIELFVVCTEFYLCSGLVKFFLLRFSNVQTKRQECSHFVTFQPLSRIYSFSFYILFRSYNFLTCQF